MKWRSTLVLLAFAAGLLGVAADSLAANPKPPTKVFYSNKNDVSPALKTMTPLRVTGKPKEMPVPTESRHHAVRPTTPDAAIQKGPLAPTAMVIDQNFVGQPNTFGGMPPDTQGDVGRDHYVQWNNLAFAVYSKTGTQLYPATGYAAGNSLWQGFGGPCENSNDGDPITIYDEMADRWVMSQFALPTYPDPPFFECLAVSQTNDPTGAWYRYEFGPFTYMNDYPKLGVWPDGYYMTANLFDMDTGYGYAVGAWALERAAMLAGNQARAVYFDLGTNDPFTAYWTWAMLPSDCEGTPPPVGAPNIFASLIPDEWAEPWPTPSDPVYPPADVVNMWAFHVDWADTANSTFTLVGDVALAALDYDVCASRDCIPQPGTSQRVDSIDGRLMHRLQYRNFGTREALTSNITVDLATGVAGVRWFELQNTGTGWTVANEASTLNDGVHRWMGSAALDASGDLAVGYSVSSGTVYPGVSAAGRLATDAANTLQAEIALAVGAGSQTGGNRWGDYSAMQVDPVDGCTFWYTQMWYQTSSAAGWQTQISSFRFPECTSPDEGTLTGTVYNAATTDPVAGAYVLAGGYSTVTGPDGVYTLHVTPGSYDMTVTAFGYDPGSATGVTVTDDLTTTQDFYLNELPSTEVDGFVRDGDSPLWPLYARVSITAPGGGTLVYTDPGSGYYNVAVYEGMDYTFTVESLVPGYAPETRLVTVPVGGTTENFYLLPDNCGAPGYGWSPLPGLNEAFDATTVPAGWTVVDNIGNGQVWAFDNPGGRTNNTGGTGNFAIVDSDYYYYGGTQDTELITPLLDLSGETPPVNLTFNTQFNGWSYGADIADVDVRVDGGPWQNVWSTGSPTDLAGLQTVDLSTYAAAGLVQIRFHYYDAAWDYWWQIDDVIVGTASPDPPECVWSGGGLVYGQVRDYNTHAGLDGATVSVDTGQVAGTTTAAPLGAGFYQMFVPGPGLGPNTRTWTASRPKYQTLTFTGAVNVASSMRLDFDLPAGKLAVNPTVLTQWVDPAASADQNFALVNTGTAAAGFELKEYPFAAPMAPKRTFPLRKVAVDRDKAPGLMAPGMVTGDKPVKGPHAPNLWGAGAVLPTGSKYRHGGAACDNGAYYIVGGWDSAGLASTELLRYDAAGDAWATTLAGLTTGLSNIPAACVGNYLYSVGGYDGANIVNAFNVYDIAGDSWTETTGPITGYGVALAAYDGKVWAFGGSGATATSNESWMYDPALDTWFRVADMPFGVSQAGAVAVGDYIYLIGGWANFPYVQRYDPQTDTWDVSGPQLLIGRQGAVVGEYGNQIYVLGGGTGWTGMTSVETYDPYQWPGGTWLENAEPLPTAMTAGAGACVDDKMWFAGGTGTVDYSTNLFKDDGLTCTGYFALDIPWFSVDPATGTVPALDDLSPITGTFDANVPWGTWPDWPSGLWRAQLRVKNDTPYAAPMLGLNFVVRFTDVPDSSIFAPFIYGLAGSEITLGCAWHGFCPNVVNGTLLNQAMAAFLSRAMAGGDANVPTTGNIAGWGDYDCDAGNSYWTDVPAGNTFCKHANYLAAHGIETAGCGDHLFCPLAEIDRAKSSMWLALGMLDGAPLPTSGNIGGLDWNCAAGGTTLFGDVDPEAVYCPHVHYLYGQSVTNGCAYNPAPPPALLYCPGNTLLREQMAKFIVLAFDIPYLP